MPYEILIPLILGALISWVLCHYYYKRSRRDVEFDRIAQRLDWADPYHKAFLVAAYDYGGYVPLYALINWTGKMKNGTEAGGSSTGCVMYRALRSGDKRILAATRINNAPPQEIKFQLTKRGIECAKYLQEEEVDYAHFDVVNTIGAEVLFNQCGFPPR